MDEPDRDGASIATDSDDEMDSKLKKSLHNQYQVGHRPYFRPLTLLNVNSQRKIREAWRRYLGIDGYEPDDFQSLPKAYTDDELARWKAGEAAFAISENNFHYDFSEDQKYDYNKEAIKFFVYQFGERINDPVNPHYASYGFPARWKEASYIRGAIKAHVTYARDRWREATKVISEERRLAVLDRKKHRSRKYTVSIPSETCVFITELEPAS